MIEHRLEIPLNKIIMLMSKNKKLGRKIKMSIKQLIPESFAWHNCFPQDTVKMYLIDKQMNGLLASTLVVLGNS